MTRSRRSRERRVHGDVEGRRGDVRRRVLSLVCAIPEGRVMTYGQVAAVLGSRVSPRAVGWILHGCPEHVPWHRVVNASGGCSTDRLPDVPAGLQRALLEREGVAFSHRGTLDLEQVRWWPQPGAFEETLADDW